MNNRAGLIIGIVIVLLLAVLFMGKERVFWGEMYHPEGKDPYDLNLFKELLESSVENESFVEEIDSSLRHQLDHTISGANYIYVGNHFDLPSEEIEVLYDWIKKGNTALICSKHFPSILSDSYSKLSEEYIINIDSIQQFSMTNSSETFTFKYLFKNETAEREWTSFSHVYKQMNYYEILETNKQAKITYMREKVGNGFIYLYSDPIVFSNLILRTKEGFEHANQVLSFLNQGATYWENANRKFQKNDQPIERNSSPLKFFLSEKSFRAGWYTLLAGALLFLIFRSKRRQRIIPIIKPNINSSIAFAQSVGQLYFQSKSPHYIAEEMMNNYFFFVRKKYRLITNIKDFESVIPKISKKSGISEEQLDSMYKTAKYLLTDLEAKKSEVAELHQKLEYFYKNCK